MLRDDTGAAVRNTASPTEGTPAALPRGTIRHLRLEASKHGVERHADHVDGAAGQPEYHP